MARAQRSHDKELARATELSELNAECADLPGHARGIGECNRPRGNFNTPSPNNQGDGSFAFSMGATPSQHPPPSAHLATR